MLNQVDENNMTHEESLELIKNNFELFCKLYYSMSKLTTDMCHPHTGISGMSGSLSWKDSDKLTQEQNLIGRLLIHLNMMNEQIPYALSMIEELETEFKRFKKEESNDNNRTI